jgi:ferredoxin-NADP reductase
MPPPRKLRCTVAAIADHGGRVYTLDLATETPAPLFHPGQFLHLTAEAYDPASFWPESRVFSIASPPRERNRLRICYSVKGRYTTRMEKTLKVGSEAWIKLPYGDFVIDGASDAVLIAGGTGISAFTAFLEALPPAHPRRVTLLYGARTPALWLFRDMIERQLATCPSFSALFFAESGLPSDLCRPSSVLCRPSSDFCPPSSVSPSSVVCYLPGRIFLDTVFRPPSSVLGPLPSDRRPLTADRCLPPSTEPSSVLGHLSSAGQSSVLCPPSSVSPASVFYLSGPPVMLKSLSADLRARGIAEENIRTDAWE